MEYLKSWTFCVCISLVISVIFSLFSPKGKMNSFYKMLISVFVFLSFIYPLKDINAKKLEWKDSIVTQNEIREALPYENMLENEIRELLEENSFSGCDIRVEMSIDGEGEITVEKAEVAVPAEYGKDEIARLIKDNLKINARVFYIGE